MRLRRNAHESIRQMISVWCSGASGETERDERGERLEGEGIHCDPCIVNSSSVPGRERDRERRGERDVVQEDWRRIYSREKRYVLAWTGQLFSQSPSYLRTRTYGHCHNYLNAILTHTFPFPFPLPSTFLHSLRPSPVYDTASTSDAPFAVVLRIVARARAPLRPL